MADEKLSLHIDTDWKKEAQEEKRKLAEAEQKRAAAASQPAVTGAAATAQVAADPAAARGGVAARGRGGRELPEASMAHLVQTLVTQALFYMGDLSVAGGSPNINLDMAKLQIDLMNVLEEKTKGNLSEDEQRMLDAALYEARMRYVNIASQYI